ncbi:histidine phosphatase family protein [Ornithinibacillus sp. BX22]|uniref:Histidine phosphatase family protein n=2 Tax=Ornithinibacillus TaxID=484508 RepID=A0A923RKI8_9BACI|nr:MULTISPECIES: histidine phosphatase family protein [Ornithinibacillus]MBC5637282.1 histidine phosphatase family protein [Ornithinibacillus hominis]MBS3680410.1 histidine phosphatase family protein [Ornithinibacillus massiliensis]
MNHNIYLVRHAHSVYTPDELHRPLSERGETDTKRVTQILKEEHIDYVYSSPYKRAIQTVQGVADFLRVNVLIEDRFKERRLAKKPVADFTHAITKVWENDSFFFKGGESNKMAQQRGIQGLMKVIEDHPGKNIVIGTHGNIMVLMMNYFNEAYGFQFWQELDMPDIYKLTFTNSRLIEVTRLWK